METPRSMEAELRSWNGGAGIDLKSWISHSGTFSLAVGYLTVFWPTFVAFEGYILRAGFSIQSLRGFAHQEKATPKSVEWVMNHLHIADLHTSDPDPFSEDKAFLLGNTLKEIYQAKLAWQFPHAPCIVELYAPESEDDFIDYQLSFWQVKHEDLQA